MSVVSPLDAVLYLLDAMGSPCDGVHFVNAQSTRRGSALYHGTVGTP